ncbi:hypothetical protein ACIQLJ_06490 [Microbacterium sp. NPDC091313]
MERIRRGILVAAAGAVVLAIAGCATPAVRAGAEGSRAGIEVIGAGVVIDDGGGAQLCLGPVGLSDPPTCAGMPLSGWRWEGVDGVAERAGVRWGSWAVPGRWDGERLTVDGDAVPLALYDTTPFPWPAGTGPLSEADAARIGAELAERWDGLLQSGPRDGRADVVVVFDDGTLQAEADATYGEGAVVVTSALRRLVEG